MKTALPLLLVLAALLAACQPPPPASADGPPGTRLIVAFGAEVSEPARPDFVAELEADAGVGLIYLRPLAGGAHVFVTQRPLTAEETATALRRLRARGDVVYAEPDRRVQAQ